MDLSSINALKRCLIAALEAFGDTMQNSYFMMPPFLLFSMLESVILKSV
jgi:hypothetical protein